MSNWWDVARAKADELAPLVRQVGSKRPPDRLTSVLFVHRFLLRLGLVASLQDRGWFNNEREYLQDRFSPERVEGPYRADQLLGLLFYSGLGQPSERARTLVLGHIGKVPFLGSGLFQQEDLEQDFSEGTKPGILPDEVVVWLFASDALELAAKAESANEARSKQYEKDIERSLSKSGDRVRALFEILEHQIDCGSGLGLAAFLAALVKSASAIGLEGPEVVSRLTASCILGSTSDPVDAQTARFRIATEALRSMGDKPVPLPDLRPLVRVARPLVPMPERLEESARLEFKSAFDWNSRTRQRSADMRIGLLKTIAAYLNTEGGTVLVGVDDDGTVIGVGAELEQIIDKNAQDVYEGRFREAMKNHLDPLPLHNVRTRFQRRESQIVFEVQVIRGPGVTYLVRKGDDGRTVEEVYVRDGNRTIRLQGRLRDQFVISKNLEAVNVDHRRVNRPP